MKKLLSILLATLMVLSVFSVLTFNVFATDFTSMNFSVNKQFKAGAKMDPYVLQKEGTGFLLYPNWTTEYVSIQENTYSPSQTGALVSDEENYPAPTDDHFYYVTYGLKAKANYYFRTDGTYKVDGISLTYAEPSNLNSDKVAENLKPNQFASFTTIVGGNTVSKLFFKVKYTRVKLDSELYGVVLAGAKVTIDANLNKGHLSSCSFSSMTGGGSIDSSNITYTAITLPASMTNPTGNAILLYPKYNAHTDTSVTVTQDATESEDGSATATCSVCGERTLKIPKIGSVAFDVKMPKEGDNAEFMPEITGYTSSLVKTDENPEWLDSTNGGLPNATGKFTVGRKYEALISFKPADGCFIPKKNYDITVNGEKVTANYYSVKDHHFFYVEYMPTEHTWVLDNTVAPTCTVQGSDNYVCQYCDAAKSEPIPVNDNHSWDEGVVTTAPTYKATGVKTYTCTACGATKTETIAKKKAPTVAKVSGLKASKVTYKYITLKWSKAKNANKYEVYRSTDGGKTWKKLATATKNTYTDKKVSAGKSYQYKVRGIHTASGKKGSFSAVLKTGAAPKTPVVTLKSTKSKTVTVSWKKVTGAKKYVVYKSTNGKSFTKVATVTKLTYNITKLTGGKKIYVKVYAANSYGKTASAPETIKVKK